MSFLDQIKAAQSYSGSSRPKVGVGEYVVKLVAAEYGRNQAGTANRGLAKWEVTEGDSATGLVNTYLTEGKTEEQTASNLKPYIDLLAATGYDVAKLEDDADSWQEIIINYVNAVNKRLLKGDIIIAKLVVKANPQNPERPWKNIYAPAPKLDIPEIPASIMAQLPGGSDNIVKGFDGLPAIAY